MHILSRIGIVSLLSFAMIFGLLPAASAQDTTQIRVNVIACVDPACENTVDISTMEGATVSSYNPEGDLIQRCTVAAGDVGLEGCQIMTVPLATYEITPAAGFENYVLLSTEPDVFNSPERGSVSVWYFAPPADQPAQVPLELNVNVIGCVDASCANTVDIFTMEGAVVSTYDSAGTLIDSCTVSTAADDFDGCRVVPAPEGGYYGVIVPAGYEGYTLLSEAPDIFEGPIHGVWVWYFVPPADQPVTTPVPGVVTGLPSTGSGQASGNALLVVVAMVPFALAGAAMVANRMARH